MILFIDMVDFAGGDDEPRETSLAAIDDECSDGANGGDKIARAFARETMQKDGSPAQNDAGDAARAFVRALAERISDGIVKDHTDGVPLARVELADAVVQLHLIVAAYPLHRATVDREDGRVALLER